jgi:hypothetical protein
MSTLPIPHPLAPLQRVMLRDSLASPGAGCHVEQVEIRFSGQVDAARVASAWRETVARTEVLELAFRIDGGIPGGWESATPAELSKCDGPLPDSWDGWLQTDRHQPLLFPGTVPWRVMFWPGDMRLVWTFHHALLDGRSIARILHGFLKRVAGGAAEPLAATDR